MRLLIAAAVGIGLFAIVGFALNILMLSAIALWEMSLSIYKHISKK